MSTSRSIGVEGHEMEVAEDAVEGPGPERSILRMDGIVSPSALLIERRSTSVSMPLRKRVHDIEGAADITELACLALCRRW